MNMDNNPFMPPTYSHDGSVAAAAAAQSYGGDQNVPLAMNQPAGGVMPSPNRNVLIFHILFKALAVFVYLTAGLWGTSYVLTFVLVTMLMAMGALRRAWWPRLVSARPLPSSFLRLCCCLSHYCCRCRADFWTVKNISGRLLVGLRWWNVVDDKGESKWHFQSFEDQRFVHPTDSNIFWLALFISPVVWGFLAIGALLSFKFMWFLLVQVAFGLSVINAYGYVKCKRDASKKLQALGGTVFTRGLQAYASMRSRSGGGGGSAPI